MEENLLYNGSLTKWPQWPGPIQAKAMRQELLPGLYMGRDPRTCIIF